MRLKRLHLKGILKGGLNLRMFQPTVKYNSLSMHNITNLSYDGSMRVENTLRNGIYAYTFDYLLK